MAGIIHKDLISGFLPKDTSEIAVSRHLKILVVTLGVICTMLVFLVERSGSLLPLTLSVSAVSGGPLFGLFTAGMLIPTVHTTVRSTKVIQTKSYFFFTLGRLMGWHCICYSYICNHHWWSST